MRKNAKATKAAQTLARDQFKRLEKEFPDPLPEVMSNSLHHAAIAMMMARLFGLEARDVAIRLSEFMSEIHNAAAIYRTK